MPTDGSNTCLNYKPPTAASYVEAIVSFSFSYNSGRQNEINSLSSAIEEQTASTYYVDLNKSLTDRSWCYSQNVGITLT